MEFNSGFKGFKLCSNIGRIVWVFMGLSCVDTHSSNLRVL